MQEIVLLVPDTVTVSDEYWRIVPDTLPGWTYSVSSKRDLLIRHSRIDKLNRSYKPVLITMHNDNGAFRTTIKRSDKSKSIYIQHIRYDAFPELSPKIASSTAYTSVIEVPYLGTSWYGRCKSVVYIRPVSELDMLYVRKFYPEDLPNELWAYVPDTDDTYIISTQSRGIILPRYRVDGALLKAQIWKLTTKHGKYCGCSVVFNGVPTNTMTHILVLRSFILKPGDDYEVNHIDGNTYNNVLDNLEWVTRQENSYHYNYSPEMAEKRALGYKHISDWGSLHQKEIQNRPDVNLKRGNSVRLSWTDERKQKQSKYSKERWKNASSSERLSQVSGLLAHNEQLHNQKLKRLSFDED